MITDFYEIETEPVGFAIEFDQACKWCRDIDHDDSDIVNTLIDAATDQAEKKTNRVFVERTVIGKFAGTCFSKFEPNEYIELRRSPLQSVTSVTVNGDALTVDVDYIIKESPSFARILFLTSIVPDTDLGYPIEVEFVAGYGTKDNQPAWVMTALKQIVLFWYENRGDVSTDKEQELPFVVKPILAQHKIINSYG